ncbi:fibronectin type III domain-containing protein, partial [Pyxidicoccus sp. 3LFB2]
MTRAKLSCLALLLLGPLLLSACKDVEVPSRPLALAATGEPGAMRLSWFEPAEDGGSPITGYRVEVEPREPGVTVAVDGRSARVSGLRAREGYRFTVAAENAAGAVGPPASVGPVQVPDVPDAPTGLVAERGDRQVRLTWVAPSDGGLPILRYTVTTYPGGARLETSGPEATVVVHGLTNGAPYAFTVLALNAVGEGPASEPSATVVPARPPD